MVVLGTIEDLDFIERLANTIDVPTQQILSKHLLLKLVQILIKNWVQELEQDMTKAMYLPGIIGENPDIAIGDITGGAATSLTLGGTTGSISNQAAAGATGSLGMLVDFNTLDLQVELTLLSPWV